jgi:Tfp pilus assembly protein PilZ
MDERMDKRTQSRRAKKRLMVKYGLEKADRTAFTKNISDTGLRIQTNHVFTPGTTINVEIHLPDKVFSMWAKVAWAKKVPAQLAHLMDCGMGLAFIEPTEEWLQYYERWRQD